MLENLARRLPRTILITRHDKIGDFVLVLPLCKAIKEQCPDMRIGVLVSKVNYEFAHSIEFIDFVILLSSDFRKTVSDIRSESPDISVSCYIDSRLGALLLAARIPVRIAPATKIAQLFFNCRVNQRRSRVEKTEWQYNLELVSALFPDDSLVFKPPLLTFPDVKGKSRQVIFHPGSGGSSEGNLKPLDYVRLARCASTMPNLEIVFTFGPSDQLISKQIQNAVDFPAKIITEQMTLINFCKTIAQSLLFVSTSTGPMHLAGAVNTSTLSFFGTSMFASDKRWAPINDPKHQSNFLIKSNYESGLVDSIESRMMELLSRSQPFRDLA